MSALAGQDHRPYGEGVKGVARKLAGKAGSAALEAMGFMLAAIACLVIMINVAAAYWDLNLMNSTAQSIALSAQSVMDRHCQPQSTDAQCAQAEADARAVAGNILADAQKSMILADDPKMTGPLNGPDITRQRTVAQGGLSAGWGWTDVKLETTFHWLGTSQSNGGWMAGPSQFPVRAGAFNASYRDPRSP